MAWFALGLVFIVAGYVVWRRVGVAPPPTPPGPRQTQIGRELGREDRGQLPAADRSRLLAAFRPEDATISADAEAEDRALVERALRLLADHVGASCAVLWRYDIDADGALVAAACVPANKRIEPDEATRLLLDLAAAEQRSSFNAGGDQLTLYATGVMLGNTRGCVSVHFDAAPAMERQVVAQWVASHARVIADQYELVRYRAALAIRNKKLRHMMDIAKTLQGSRDPDALEQVLARDVAEVAGAEWAIIVRWDQVQRVGVPTYASEGAPNFGATPSARQGSLVGEVCRLGKAKIYPDARPLLSSLEAVFDGRALPPGTESLLIAPIRRSDREVAIGALVLGHSRRGALASIDAHAANDVGTVAAGALETAWAVQEATARARTDQLTGLPNRRHFDEFFTRILGETDRYGGNAALVLVDVDHFKQVNDTYGHEAGDAVLVALGAALQDARRTTDLAARLGGEELALVLPQTDQVGAVEVAERLRRRIEAMEVSTPAGPVRVTASFGVAMYEARSGLGGRLFELADKALYAAKRGGRNRVEIAAAN